MESQLTDVARVTQLAVAPVFLLTAVAAIIGALNARLGRTVDRRRALQERLRGCAEADERDYRAELRMLSRRIRITNWARPALIVGCASGASRRRTGSCTPAVQRLNQPRL